MKRHNGHALGWCVHSSGVDDAGEFNEQAVAASQPAAGGPGLLPRRRGDITR